MTRAYDELYISRAQKTMAQTLDRAVNEYGMELQEFFSLFLVSSVSSRFQVGDCSIIAGRSGAELVRMVLEETGLNESGVNETVSEETVLDETGPNESGRLADKRSQEQDFRADRSKEYWTGWTIAYYQWYSAMTFHQIQRRVPIESVRDMYPQYHEMDILQFCDAMEERICSEASQQETRLGFYRRRLGLSQSQLAQTAEIPVRTIQQYEQRRKDINRAQANYLIRLARVLGCREADLMERRG